MKNDSIGCILFVGMLVAGCILEYCLPEEQYADFLEEKWREEQIEDSIRKANYNCPAILSESNTKRIIDSLADTYHKRHPFVKDISTGHYININDSLYLVYRTKEKRRNGHYAYYIYVDIDSILRLPFDLDEEQTKQFIEQFGEYKY